MDPLGKGTAVRPIVGLIGAFMLAIANQYLFYGAIIGVSYPIFILLLYAYLLHDRRNRLREISGFGWFMFAVVMLLSLTYALFNNPFFSALNFLAIPPLVFLHMAYLRGAKRIPWWDIRIIEEALTHLFALSMRHVPTVFRIVRVTAARKGGTQRKSALGKVLIGLCISVPLLIVVVNLLASADGVFQRALSGFPDWWNGLSIGEGVSRLLWILLAGIAFFCYLWGFVKPGRSSVKVDRTVTKSVPEESQYVSMRIDPIIMATLLVSVNVVYVLFVVLQFSYLFGAWEGALPDGKTYAEYARSGFMELVAVSFINFAILIIALLSRGAEDPARLRSLISKLLYLLVGCSGVMLYSAYSRLILYEEMYGYTYIRFLVHAFMIFLAILLIIAAIRIRTDVIPLAKCYIVIGLASYVFMNYVGMDRVIAGNNIDRYREGGAIDPQYLSTLSADAMPLLAEFSKKEYPGLKPLLKDRWKELANESRRPWQSFNLSVYAAEEKLHDLFRE
ncbi:DUF4173 domain-containing protein [Cohnella endophytica]|uniref:DUF4173 domain-containing protein n=1 Tax=Cohnella endophytica TaxID=2419778 RepID=A0A494XU86_9BACL|nr:DUF4173 domain-containing protein [Cohnella endophytica]RKP51649.1 DUF4173 domain-containing protein [Cohnella endophytica]